MSCLVYGFGFGIEAYCQEIIIKEYLGVKNWSKVEGTLDTLSGTLLIPILVIMNNTFSLEGRDTYINKLITTIMYSYYIVISSWIIFPTITYIQRYMRNRKKIKNTHNFMQHNIL